MSLGLVLILYNYMAFFHWRVTVRCYWDTSSCMHIYIDQRFQIWTFSYQALCPMNNYYFNSCIKFIGQYWTVWYRKNMKIQRQRLIKNHRLGYTLTYVAVIDHQSYILVCGWVLVWQLYSHAVSLPLYIILDHRLIFMSGSLHCGCLHTNQQWNMVNGVRCITLPAALMCLWNKVK